MKKKYFSPFTSHFSLSRGFTLVEMLIVIALVGVIAATLIFGINPIGQLQKSNDAHRKSDLAAIQKALELYYQDNGSYPASSADFKIYINASTKNWGTSWSPYITTLPKDPIPTNTYVYYSPASSNGQTYYLYATLQRGASDKQGCNNGNACVSLSQGVAGFPTANACGGICNYGVSSPNVSP